MPRLEPAPVSLSVPLPSTLPMTAFSLAAAPPSRTSAVPPLPITERSAPSGRVPRSQFAGSSQLPVPGLIHSSARDGDKAATPRAVVTSSNARNLPTRRAAPTVRVFADP